MPVRNLFIIALATIVSMTCYSTASKNRYANLFAEAVNTIEKEALQKVPRRKLFNYAMEGMTAKLDGHSRYITDEMYQIFSEELNQEFGGVGMYVDTNPATGRLTVLAPIPGSPAFESGIQAGDVLVEIDGKSTTDMERGNAVELIRGPRGETVDVLVERTGKTKLHKLERAFIHEPSVHGDFRNKDGSWNCYLKDYPNIGFIRLSQFGSKSSQEMRETIEAISGETDALILDLRNNAGGLLDGAIEICDLFLENGKPIVSRMRRDNISLAHNSRTPAVFPAGKPMVVLINRDSASASEIVAACLQDHKRAAVIGENSWGKGTVQHVIPIELGKSALKLTTASYWRPSGKNIDRYSEEAIASGVWGVQPDKGMELELSREEIFNNRRRRSFLDLRGLVDPQQLIDRDEDRLIDSKDKPLERAIKFLNDKLNKRVAAKT